MEAAIGGDRSPLPGLLALGCNVDRRARLAIFSCFFGPSIVFQSLSGLILFAAPASFLERQVNALFLKLSDIDTAVELRTVHGLFGSLPRRHIFS